jgi:molecular chaperone DnaK
LVDARNQADSLIYSTEKSIKDLGDKVDDATKSSVEAAAENLKKAMEGDDTQEIIRLSEELTQVSHKLAEAMYQQASQADGQQAGAQPGAEDTDRTGPSAPEEDVVDADFEEVKEDDDK